MYPAAEVSPRVAACAYLPLAQPPAKTLYPFTGPGQVPLHPLFSSQLPPSFAELASCRSSDPSRASTGSVTPRALRGLALYLCKNPLLTASLFRNICPGWNEGQQVGHGERCCGPCCRTPAAAACTEVSAFSLGNFAQSVSHIPIGTCTKANSLCGEARFMRT